MIKKRMTMLLIVKLNRKFNLGNCWKICKSGR